MNSRNVRRVLCHIFLLAYTYGVIFSSSLCIINLARRVQATLAFNVVLQMTGPFKYRKSKFAQQNVIIRQVLWYKQRRR